MGATNMARNSVNDDAVNSGDNLDQLLNGFLARNEDRADPNYVLEPVDFSTPIPDRFVRILRDSSFPVTEADVIEQVVESEPETNSGLILLAENYDKNSRKKLQNARIYGAVATVVLFVSTLLFSALAGYVVAGLIAAVLAGVFMVLSRSSRTQAEEIHQIAEALTQPEESS